MKKKKKYTSDTRVLNFIPPQKKKKNKKDIQFFAIKQKLDGSIDRSIKIME